MYDLHLYTHFYFLSLMQRTLPKLGDISTLMNEVQNDLLRFVCAQTWTPGVAVYIHVDPDS